MSDLIQRYSDRIVGVLSCYDRVVIHGSIQLFSYAGGMASFLRARDVRLFDFPKFAMPYREAIKENAERIARENGIEVQFMRNGKTRKEEVVAAALAVRGDAPGLVAVLTALEVCPTYEARFDKQTGRTSLRPDRAKCLHYYFYFIDEVFGLCFMRVPTWCPFGIQAYFNGHNVLAAKLRKASIAYKMLDNAFTEIGDWAKAQALADESDTRVLHETLDKYARRFCPPIVELEQSYRWCLAQVEYSTDIVFRKQSELRPIYESLVQTAIHAVKPADVMTFLGRKNKLSAANTDEIGNDFHTRIHGTRLKHRIGPCSIKMYDKSSLILRIETTTNDPTWFHHYRTVDHRDGTSSHELAPLKKSIYSLHDLRQIATAANRRYIEFLSSLDDPTAAVETVARASEPIRDHDRNFRGFNFFAETDVTLFEAVVRGENVIQGFRNKTLRQALPDRSSGQIARALQRLRVHGLIRKIGRTYKYYVTELGRTLITAGLKLKRLVLIPEVARAMAI